MELDDMQAMVTDGAIGLEDTTIRHMEKNSGKTTIF